MFIVWSDVPKKCRGDASECFRLLDDGWPWSPGVGALKLEVAQITRVPSDRLINDLAHLYLQRRVVRVAQAVGNRGRVGKAAPAGGPASRVPMSSCLRRSHR